MFTWLWLTEFSGISLTCFTLSRLTIFTNVSPLKPEISLDPLLTAIFVFSAKGREIYEFHALKREPVKALGPLWRGPISAPTVPHRRRTPSRTRCSRLRPAERTWYSARVLSGTHFCDAFLCDRCAHHINHAYAFEVLFLLLPLNVHLQQAGDSDSV